MRERRIFGYECAGFSGAPARHGTKCIIYRVLAVVLTCFLCSCGIEEYIYLTPVPSSSIRQYGDMSGAAITLPTIPADQANYFRNFTIFYRIYAGGIQTAGGPNDYAAINPALDSDYRIFLPYTSETTSTSSNTGAVGTLFTGRSYWRLEVENSDSYIEELLVSGGRTLDIDFLQIPDRQPVLTVGGASYRLYRSNGSGSPQAFTPVPTRYFLDTPDLRSAANATVLRNADVAPYSSTVQNVFVAMYIAATGIDANYSPIYSSPTFIGVFRLP